jgi:5-formyltetrahydrofolate cyclo-ligase
MQAQRQALRAKLRAQRRTVSPLQRFHAARLVAEQVDRAFHLRAGQRIAVYSALAEELDSRPLMSLASSRGCEIYLPRIDRRTRTIRFVAASNVTRANHLGIAEPVGSRVIGARWLNLVFLPLVGFDAHGMRLGMGGGYYNRTFAFRNLRSAWRAPKLIGIAYAFQQVSMIEPAAHDVMLDAVVTEVGVIDKHIL